MVVRCIKALASFLSYLLYFSMEGPRNPEGGKKVKLHFFTFWGLLAKIFFKKIAVKQVNHIFRLFSVL